MAHNHQGIRHDILADRYVANLPRYTNKTQHVTPGFQEQSPRQQNMYSGSYPEYDGYLVPHTLRSDLSDRSDVQDPQSQV